MSIDRLPSHPRISRRQVNTGVISAATVRLLGALTVVPEIQGVSISHQPSSAPEESRGLILREIQPVGDSAYGLTDLMDGNRPHRSRVIKLTAASDQITSEIVAELPFHARAIAVSPVVTSYERIIAAFGADQATLFKDDEQLDLPIPTDRVFHAHFTSDARYIFTEGEFPIAVSSNKYARFGVLDPYREDPSIEILEGAPDHQLQTDLRSHPDGGYYGFGHTISSSYPRDPSYSYIVLNQYTGQERSEVRVFPKEEVSGLRFVAEDRSRGRFWMLGYDTTNLVHHLPTLFDFNPGQERIMRTTTINPYLFADIDFQGVERRVNFDEVVRDKVTGNSFYGARIAGIDTEAVSRIAYFTDATFTTPKSHQILNEDGDWHKVGDRSLRQLAIVGTGRERFLVASFSPDLVLTQKLIDGVPGSEKWQELAGPTRLVLPVSSDTSTGW